MENIFRTHPEEGTISALRLLEDIDRTSHSLLQLLKQEPQLLNVALHLWESLHDTKQIVKREKGLWR